MSSYCFQLFSHEQGLVNVAMLFPISVTWDKPVSLPEMHFALVNTKLVLVFQESVQVSLPLPSKVTYLSFLAILRSKLLIECEAHCAVLVFINAMPLSLN